MALFLSPMLIAACRPDGTAGLPAGVVMEQVGSDATGCAMFRPQPASGSTVQTIFYRSAGGGFTMRREEADCAPPTGGRE
jgi:hypothetical protein